MSWRVFTAIVFGVTGQMVALLVFFNGYAFDFDKPLRHDIWAGHLSPPAKVLWLVAWVLAFAGLGAVVGYRLASRLGSGARSEG